MVYVLPLNLVFKISNFRPLNDYFSCQIFNKIIYNVLFFN